MCNIIAAAFASILELIIIPIYYINNLFGDDTLQSFILRYVVQPMFHYGLIIGLAIYALRRTKNEMIKNMIPLISMSILTMMIIKYHYVFNIVLALPIIPICLSAAYGSQLVTGITSAMSIIAYTAGVMLTFWHGKSEVSTNYIYNITIGYVILIGLYITVKAVVESEQEKQQLIIQVNKEKLKFKYESLHDERTNLPNVKGLELTYDEWRHSNGLYIAIIDIDHFKNVNDTYGHTFGNLVLQELGKLLNKTATDNIFVSRYGGEEFVLLFKNTTFNNAKNIIQTLLLLFSEVKYEMDSSLVITFSGGLCKVNPKKDLSYNVAYADTYLYDAKADGRNRIYGTDTHNNKNTLLSERQSSSNAD